MSRVLQYFVIIFSFLLVVPSINAQTIKSAKSGNWNDAATWEGGVLPTSTNDVVIATGHTVTVSTASTNQNCNNLTVEPGGFLTASGTNTASSGKMQLKVYGSSVINNGKFGTGTDGLSLDIMNPEITLSGSDTLKICTIRPNNNMEGTLIIAGNVQLSYKGAALWLQNGTTAGKNFKKVIINQGASLVTMAGSNISPAASQNTNIGLVPTIEINGTVKIGGSFIVRCTTGQPIIKISNTGTLSIDNSLTLVTYKTNNQPGIVTVDGTLTTGIVGGTFDMSNDSLLVTGNGTFVMGDRGTLVIGSASGLDPVNGQIRTRNRIFSTRGNYRYVLPRSGKQVTGPDLPDNVGRLTISDSTGVVSLSKHVTVDSMFTIQGGKLKLGDNNLVVAGITGGALWAYVVTDGKGILKVENVDTANVLFPVGIESSYNPVTIKNSGTVNSFSVKVDSIFANPISDYTKIVKRQWTIMCDGSGANAELTFQWNSPSDIGTNFNPSNPVKIGRFTGTTWEQKVAIVANPSPGIYTASADNFTDFSNFCIGNDNFVSVKDADDIPKTYELFQNYPNPFNPVTVIRYSVPQKSFITLKVYDIIGKEIATLVNEEKSAGNYEMKFNGSNLSAGIYLYRIQAGNFVSSKKMVLIK